MMTADRLMAEIQDTSVNSAIKKLKEKPLVKRRPSNTRFVTYRCPFCPAIVKGRKNAQIHILQCVGKRAGVALTGR